MRHTLRILYIQRLWQKGGFVTQGKLKCKKEASCARSVYIVDDMRESEGISSKYTYIYISKGNNVHVDDILAHSTAQQCARR